MKVILFWSLLIVWGEGVAAQSPVTEPPLSTRLARPLRVALDRYDQLKAAAKPNTHPWYHLNQVEQELILAHHYDLLKEAGLLGPSGRPRLRGKTAEELPIPWEDAHAFYHRAYTLYENRARYHSLGPLQYLGHLRDVERSEAKPDLASLSLGKRPSAATVNSPRTGRQEGVDFPAVELVMAVAKYDQLKHTLGEEEAWEQLNTVEQKWILLYQVQVLRRSEFPFSPAHRLVQVTSQQLERSHILLPATEVQKLYGRTLESVDFSTLEQIATGVIPVPWQRASQVMYRSVRSIGAERWGLSLETLYEEVYAGIFLSRSKRDYLMAQIHFLFQKGCYPSPRNVQSLLHHPYPFRLLSLISRTRQEFGSYEVALRIAGFDEVVNPGQCRTIF